MTFENVKFHEYLVCKSDNCHMALLLRTPGHFDSLLELDQSTKHPDIWQWTLVPMARKIWSGYKYF